MTYEQLMYIHLATVVPCFFIGAYLLLSKKGGTVHRNLGKVYMVLMFFTATVTLFMEAKVGSLFLNHFGWIHSFSFLTIGTVPLALYRIKQGNVTAHKWAMISLYFGAIIIAGGFTFVPGRYLHYVFFG